MDFSTTLKTLRKEAKLSQEQLAEKLNVSRQAVTKWETKAGVPDIDNLLAISALFGITVNELILDKKVQLSKGDFIYESVTEYDIAEVKHYDISLGGVNTVAVIGCESEKLKIRLLSNVLSELEKFLKIKLDDIKKRIDVNLDRGDRITETQLKDGLQIEIQLPKQYIKNIELSTNAKNVSFNRLSFNNLQFCGKTSCVSLVDISGYTEIDCNIDMDIVCQGYNGNIDINQLNSTSVIHVPDYMCILAKTKGIGNKILFSENGNRCDSFSDDTAGNIIELNGLKSELVIDRVKEEQHGQIQI